MPRRIQWLVGLILFGAWLVTLALPAVWTGQHGGGVITGFDVLVVGPLGVLMGQFGWFANPLLIPWGLPLVTFSKRPNASALMMIALLLLVLTADAFLWTMIPDDFGEHAIVAHDAGYYVRVAVMVTMAFWLCAAVWAQGMTDE